MGNNPKKKGISRILRRDLHSSIRSLLDAKNAQNNVTIKGWVKSVRKQKKVAFLHVNDGSTAVNLQVVASPSLVEAATNGCSVEIEGNLVASQGAGQQFELQAQDVKITGSCDPEEFPLQKKFHTYEFLRDLPHIRHRSTVMGSVLRIRNTAFFQLHSFFQERGFLNIHTPIITGNDCEGGGEQFTLLTPNYTPESSSQSPSHPNNNNNNNNSEVKKTDVFFGHPAMLTVSGQLHAEAFAQGMKNVYTFGPTFRAENSNTPRHLAEFWMLEPEMAFCDNSGAMDVAEACVKSTIGKVLDTCRDELETLKNAEDGCEDLISQLEETRKIDNFARMSYDECMKELLKRADDFSFPPIPGDNLKFEHEQFIAKNITKGPVFVTDFPLACKPFYTRRNPDGKTASCFDLLLPRVGELVGGSAREYRADVLEKAMDEAGEGLKETLKWYLELRRFGCGPSAGFGLGFDRLLLFMTGMKNVRDVVPVPRHPGGCKL